MHEPIRIFTFPPAAGLPTTGPFALKLAMALRLAGIPYEIHIEPDVQKSPKRTIPWIEVGDVKMADTALILSWLADKRGVDLERDLSLVQRARGLALRALLEEHWYQVFAIELLLDQAGIGSHFPPSVIEAREHNLFERGMLRHTREEVTWFGKADLEAVAAWLDGQEWAIADRPTLTDCSVWGLFAPVFYLPLPTPCFSHARTLAPLRAFIERARTRCFPEIPPPEARAAKADLAQAT
jgi:glutathione S-transferase